jgi:hypothetical protein
MQDQLASLAYNGQWDSVLSLLRQRPDLANATSAGKGYTALHQAAWHGADVPVIGALLALGAAPRLMTSKRETASDIARRRHPERADLDYLLRPSARSLAQLLRKLIAETPGLFDAYDGNRLICDRLIACLGETWSEAEEPTAGDVGADPVRGIEGRLEAALQAITGTPLPPGASARFSPAEHYHFTATGDFVRRTLLPPLRDLAARAALIRLEPRWTVLADLFDPAPDLWGLRGDLFLWMEMRHALCHCELSGPPDGELERSVERRLTACFCALTGTELAERGEVHVPRFERGGMSSGWVCAVFWREEISLLARRAGWLWQSWQAAR